MEEFSLAGIFNPRVHPLNYRRFGIPSLVLPSEVETFPVPVYSLFHNL